MVTLRPRRGETLGRAHFSPAASMDSRRFGPTGSITRKSTPNPYAIASCFSARTISSARSMDRSPERLVGFREVQARLLDLAKSEDFDLIPVLTNTRLLIGDYDCWTSVGFGAANVSVAHALSRRFSRVLFASDGNGVDAPPGASHPLLDQYFSTAAVQVWHEQAGWSRIDKLRLLAEWPPALRVVQPCHRVQVLPEGQLNCGHCEKCIRTMLGLLALGKLEESEAFAVHDVTPEMIGAIPVLNPVKAELLQQLIAPLRSAGREVLVSALQEKIGAFRRRGAHAPPDPRVRAPLEEVAHREGALSSFSWLAKRTSVCLHDCGASHGSR